MPIGNTLCTLGRSGIDNLQASYSTWRHSRSSARRWEDIRFSSPRGRSRCELFDRHLTAHTDRLTKPRRMCRAAKRGCVLLRRRSRGKSSQLCTCSFSSIVRKKVLSFKSEVHKASRTIPVSRRLQNPSQLAYGQCHSTPMKGCEPAVIFCTRSLGRCASSPAYSCEAPSTAFSAGTRDALGSVHQPHARAEGLRTCTRSAQAPDAAWCGGSPTRGRRAEPQTSCSSSSE